MTWRTTAATLTSSTKRVQYQYSARRARPLKVMYLLKQALTAAPKPIGGIAGAGIGLATGACRGTGALGVSRGDMRGGGGGWEGAPSSRRSLTRPDPN